MFESTATDMSKIGVADVLAELKAYRAALPPSGSAEGPALWGSFPARAVLRHMHQVGKEFAEADVLAELTAVQEEVFALPGSKESAEGALLRESLYMLLDKHLGYYDYLSYTGTHIVTKLTIAPDLDDAEHRAERIAHVIWLLCDVARFECRTLLGLEDRFPDLLSTERNRKLRVLNALKAIKVFAEHTDRVQLPMEHGELTAAWQEEVRSGVALHKNIGIFALEYISRIEIQFKPELLELFELSMMPVWTIHDEYMFIRILQVFEILFNITIKGFEAAQAALQAKRPEQAAPVMRELAAIYAASTATFRVLTTMTKESFSAFREYTDGASAIQSVQYKRVEAMAAHPAMPRLNSEAFRSVPMLKQEVEAGQVLVFEDLLRDTDGMDEQALDDLQDAMRELDKRFVAWKNMHYQIAVKMLGSKRGTGGSPGTPYLKMYMSMPLFPFLKGVAKL